MKYYIDFNIDYCYTTLSWTAGPYVPVGIIFLRLTVLYSPVYVRMAVAALGSHNWNTSFILTRIRWHGWLRDDPRAIGLFFPLRMSSVSLVATDSEMEKLRAADAQPPCAVRRRMDPGLHCTTTLDRFVCLFVVVLSRSLTYDGRQSCFRQSHKHNLTISRHRTVFRREKWNSWRLNKVPASIVSGFLLEPVPLNLTVVMQLGERGQGSHERICRRIRGRRYQRAFPKRGM